MQKRAGKPLGGLGRWAAPLTRPGRQRTAGALAWAALLLIWLTVPALAAESPPEWHWWHEFTVKPAAAQGSPAQWSYSFEPSGQAQATYPGDVTVAGALTAASISPGSLTTLFASPPPIGTTAPNLSEFTGLGVNGTAPGTSGLTFGSVVASSATDLTKQIALFAGVGFSVTSGQLNYVVPSGASHVFLVNGATVGSLNGTGYNGAVGGTTPGAGSFTTVAASGAITPSQTSGVVGTTTNNNANAGSDGEFISSTVLQASQVALVTATAANITSVSLTAGDWDCRGNIVFNPAGTTTITAIEAVINTTSATLPTSPGNGAESLENITFTTGGVQILQTGTLRVSIASTSSVFLIASTAFGTSTMNGFGFIGCRRVR